MKDRRDDFVVILLIARSRHKGSSSNLVTEELAVKSYFQVLTLYHPSST